MKDSPALPDRQPDPPLPAKQNEDNTSRGWSSYVRDVAYGAVREASNFGEGLATGFALNSVNALNQAVDQTGLHLPQVRFNDQEAMEKSTSGEVGSFVGSAINFALVNTLVRKTGLKSTLALATTGALEGSLLTPTAPQASPSDFLLARAENGGSSFLTYAAFGAIANKTESTLGRLNLRSTARSRQYYSLGVHTLSNATGGLVGGMASAELNSLVQRHELASLPEVAGSSLNGFAFGGTFGLASSAIGASLTAVRNRQMVQPSSNLSRYISYTEGGNAVPDLIQVAAPVSRGFVTAVANSLSEMPKPVGKLLRENGTSVVLVGRVTESFPELKGQRPIGWPDGTYENCANFYDPEQKLVVFAEKYIEPFGKNKLVKTPTEGGLQRHEVGHSAETALDRAAGSPAFLAAYREDAANIKNPEHREILNYYLQPENEVAAARETWADLFADLHGGPAFKEFSEYLRYYFSKSRQVVAENVRKLSDEANDNR